MEPPPRGVSLGVEVDPEVARVPREDDRVLVGLARLEHHARVRTVWKEKNKEIEIGF